MDAMTLLIIIKIMIVTDLDPAALGSEIPALQIENTVTCNVNTWGGERERERVIPITQC